MTRRRGNSSWARHYAAQNRASNRFHHGVDTANFELARTLNARDAAPAFTGPRPALRPEVKGPSMNAAAPYSLTPGELIRWRMALKTGDTVLWQPHGMVSLIRRVPESGTWEVVGAQLIGSRSAPERDLRPVPGFKYAGMPEETPAVDEDVQPMPDIDADIEPEPPQVTARPESQPPALWELRTPPRDVSVEEMNAAEQALAEAKAKREAAREAPAPAYPDGAPVQPGDRVEIVAPGHRANGKYFEVHTLHTTGARNIGVFRQLLDQPRGANGLATLETYTVEGRDLRLLSRGTPRFSYADGTAIALYDEVRSAGRVGVVVGFVLASDPPTVSVKWKGGIGSGSVTTPINELTLARRADEPKAEQEPEQEKPEHVQAQEPRPPVVAAVVETAEAEVKDAFEAVVSTETLPLSRIRIDGGTQARAGVNWNTVSDYAELMSEGVEFPPVKVYFDGADYWLADGFHRYHAARQIEAVELRAIVHPGDARAARLHAAGANGDHGLPRTNEDKRRAVLLLLNDPEWAKWSDREIARRCAVTQPFVSKVRHSLTENGFQSAERTGADGRTINTAGISAANAERRKPEAEAEPEPARAIDPETGEISAPVATLDFIDPVTAEVTQVAPGKLDALMSSESGEWYTPADLMALVRAALGGRLDLDPASSAEANETVMAQRFFTAADNALTRDWWGPNLYANFPYGDDLDGFIDKLLAELKAGHVHRAIVLVPARTDTAWFRKLRAFPRCFIAGRLKFRQPGTEATSSAPFPSAVIALANQRIANVEPDAFYAEFVRVFSGVGDVYRLWEVS